MLLDGRKIHQQLEIQGTEHLVNIVKDMLNAIRSRKAVRALTTPENVLHRSCYDDTWKQPRSECETQRNMLYFSKKRKE